MNVGPNYKGPKVNYVALVKFGYMLEYLEYLAILWYNVTIDKITLCQVKI